MTEALQFKVDASKKRRMRKASRRNGWAFLVGEAICVGLSILTWHYGQQLNDSRTQMIVTAIVLVTTSVSSASICRQHCENKKFFISGEKITLKAENIAWGYNIPEHSDWNHAVWQAPYTAIQALDVDPEKHLLRITWQTEQRQVLQKDIYLYYRDQERMLRELSARCGVEIRQTTLSEG